MGVLAKKNMLYLVAFYVAFSLLAPTLVFAGDRDFDFFKEENTSDQKEDCEPCIKEEIAPDPNLKKKTEEIEKRIKKSFADKEKSARTEIVLFIDPASSSSDSAVKTLARFKKDHPDWKARGVILAGSGGLKERLLQKKDYFSHDIEFSVDLTGRIRREFNVTRTPAYVVIHHGKVYTAASQPDLNEVLSRLDK